MLNIICFHASFFCDFLQKGFFCAGFAPASIGDAHGCVPVAMKASIWQLTGAPPSLFSKETPEKSNTP